MNNRFGSVQKVMHIYINLYLGEVTIDIHNEVLDFVSFHAIPYREASEVRRMLLF